MPSSLNHSLFWLWWSNTLPVFLYFAAFWLLFFLAIKRWNLSSFAFNPSIFSLGILIYIFSRTLLVLLVQYLLLLILVPTHFYFSSKNHLPYIHCTWSRWDFQSRCPILSWTTNQFHSWKYLSQMPENGKYLRTEAFLWCGTLKLPFIDFHWLGLVPSSWSTPFFMSYTTFLYTCTKFFYLSSLYFVCLSNQTLWLIQLHDLKCYFYTDEYPIYNSSPERSPELFYYFHLTTWHFQSTLKFNKSKTKFMVYTSIFFSFLWMAPLSIS